jgi:HlyD family secretion protein
METQPQLKSLRIDPSLKAGRGEPKWSQRFIILGILLFLGFGVWRLASGMFPSAPEVRTVKVAPPQTASLPGGTGGEVVLNATGYIIAAHKIALASKVVGRVAWIGVEKGDRVQRGQVIVRLEDDEYRAQLTQARGQLESLRARLAELENGSRPEEIARAKADLESAKADLQNAGVVLERTRNLVQDGVLAKQRLDDDKARFDSQTERVRALERTYELFRLGPRREQIDAVRGQVREAEGRVAFFDTQLANTLIKAPVTGTILERNVEQGEFVTTGFVGDRGAKGYVVTMADLTDLQVELDINQNDFAKLGGNQQAVLFTDAYPDRKYKGAIDEISPEANRQKATVQVKVKVLEPDEFLRPEMNATVQFIGASKPAAGTAAAPVVYIPAGTLRNDKVFVVDSGVARARTVKANGSGSQGLRVESGLLGGEELILDPSAELKDGDKVKVAGTK